MERMTQEPVIRFENVSKRFHFKRGAPRSVLEALISVGSFSRRRRPSDELWAVKNVSFEVNPGQALGIIGRNGSGKSTILKLITRILRPTDGRIMVRGRVSALLELGAGFHQDLTGRENIFLNASVLGLSKTAVETAFNDIVAFSELGEFIDMPVKHYSSGMYMRLGFSVAIHVKPDILIVDEILAVGDQAFQQKCIDYIYELKRQGTTIVIVSHNLDMMRKLCTHLVWLDNGSVRQAGVVEEIAGQYMGYSHHQQNKQYLVASQHKRFKRWGDGTIEITNVRVLDENGNECHVFQTGDKMIIEMAYLAHNPVKDPEFGLAIFRQDGVQVNGPNTKISGLNMGMVHGKGYLRYNISNLSLLPATYLITTAVHHGQLPIAFDHHEQAYSFRITAGGTENIFGLVNLQAEWEWKPESSNGNSPEERSRRD